MRKSKPLRQAQTEYRKPRPKSAKWVIENRVIPGHWNMTWDDTWVSCGEYHTEQAALAAAARIERDNVGSEFEYRIVERIWK